MTTKPYDIGAAVRLSATFTDLAGSLADPTTVRFRVKKPDASAIDWVYGVDVELVRDSLGAFHADVPIDQAGAWMWRWEGTGAIQAATEGEFHARLSAFES